MQIRLYDMTVHVHMHIHDMSMLGSMQTVKSIAIRKHCHDLPSDESVAISDIEPLHCACDDVGWGHHVDMCVCVCACVVWRCMLRSRSEPVSRQDSMV